MHQIFLCSCLRPQLVIVIIKGVLLCWFSWIMSLPIVSSPLTSHLPFLSQPRPSGMEQRLTPSPACCLLHLVGHCSRPLLQTCKLPHPLNLWCLYQWFWAISLDLKLSKYRPCRPVGFSPTIGRAARYRGNSPELWAVWKYRMGVESCKGIHWYLGPKVPEVTSKVAEQILGWLSTSMKSPGVAVLAQLGLPRDLENNGL